MTTKFGPTIVGNDESFLFTGLSAAGAAEDITSDTITFRAFDLEGNEIVKTTNDDIIVYAQTGATLGQCAIPIVPADYPAAWLAIGYGSVRNVFIAVERVTAAGVVRETQHGAWQIKGQGIV